MVKKTASYAYYALPVIGGLSLVMGMGVTLSKINLGVEEYLAQRHIVDEHTKKIVALERRVGVLDDLLQMEMEENGIIRAQNKGLHKVITRIACRESNKPEDC